MTEKTNPIKLLDGTELGSDTTKGRCGNCPHMETAHTFWTTCTKFRDKYGSYLIGTVKSRHRLQSCREAEGQVIIKGKGNKFTRAKIKDIEDDGEE